MTDLAADPAAALPKVRLLAVEGAASYLCVSRATVERLAHRGELPVVKIGGATRYAIEDLEAYVASARRRRRQRT